MTCVTHAIKLTASKHTQHPPLQVISPPENTAVKFGHNNKKIHLLFFYCIAISFAKL